MYGTLLIQLLLANIFFKDIYKLLLFENAEVSNNTEFYLTFKTNKKYKSVITE